MPNIHTYGTPVDIPNDTWKRNQCIYCDYSHTSPPDLGPIEDYFEAHGTTVPLCPGTQGTLKGDEEEL